MTTSLRQEKIRGRPLNRKSLMVDMLLVRETDTDCKMEQSHKERKTKKPFEKKILYRSDTYGALTRDTRNQRVTLSM